MSFERMTLPAKLDEACGEGDYDAAMAQLDGFMAEHAELTRQDALVQMALRGLDRQHTAFYHACVEQGGMVIDPAARGANEAFAFKAIEADDVDLLQRYLDKGQLPIDIGSSYTGDMLNEAAFCNAVSVATWLLDAKGFDVNSQKTMFSQPIPIVQAAAWGPDDYDDTRLLEVLLARGITFKGTGAINEAAKAGRVQAVYRLLAAGADIEEEITHGMEDEGVDLGTPLWMAAANNDAETVEYLIQEGANLQYRDPRQKLTPLEAAKERESEECVQVLEKALQEKK